jgi:hypothetical protein
MTCTRCGGLLHVEHVTGRRGRTILRLFACLLCGDRTDDRILLNREVAREQAYEARIRADWKARVWADCCDLVKGVRV